MKKFDKQSYSDLLADIANGSQAAFSRLYDLFYPALIQHVKSKVSSDAEAQDILHDLFLSLWEMRRTIQNIQSLPAYMYTSCRYMIIDHIKKVSTLNDFEEIDELEIDSKEQPLEEVLYYRYLLDKINQEIENLPEKCRAIFKMSRKDYMSNKEIADYLQISESTVENQVRKALQRLKVVSKDFSCLFPYLLI